MIQNCVAISEICVGNRDVIQNKMIYESSRYIMLVITISCVTTTFSQSIRQSVWILNTIFNDVTITDDVISTITNVDTDVDCGIVCGKRDNCVSFSYNDHNGTCVIYSARFTDNATYLPDLGSRHYSPALPSGPCPVDQGYVLMAEVHLCLKIIDVIENVERARDICNQSSSRLIVLDSKNKNTAFSDFVFSTLGDVTVFIGLTDEAEEGVYVWSNGNVANFTNWKHGEPNDELADNNCVILKAKTGQWNDIPCSRKHHFICENVI